MTFDLQNDGWPGRTRQNGLILADDPASMAELVSVAESFDINIVARGPLNGLATATASAPENTKIQLCLAAIRSDLDTDLEGISTELANMPSTLVWTTMDLIDPLVAMLPADRCRFLVDPDPADLTATMFGAMQHLTPSRLNDGASETRPALLDRLQEELARLSGMVANLAQQESLHPPSTREAPRSFRPEPQRAPTGFAPVSRDGVEIDPRDIREIIRLRRLREQLFPNDLFGDPAWDILLDLMAARLEHRNVSVSSLCIAAAVAPTTALRWIAKMTEQGWLERRPDPHDQRRVYIVLSDEAAGLMTEYLAADRAARQG